MGTCTSWRVVTILVVSGFASLSLGEDCESGKFPCSDGSGCLAPRYLCDGASDCADGSDEARNCAERCALLVCPIHGFCGLQDSGEVTCQCEPGFRSDHPDTCTDINECSLPVEHRVCSQRCHNTIGSYLCFCEPGYELDDDQVTCLATGSESLLMVAAGQEIFSYSMRSHQRSPLLSSVSGVQGLAVDYSGRRLFWTEAGNTSQPAVYVTDLDHPEMTKQRVAAWGLSQPHGLTFDPRTGNLYIADTGLSAMIVCRTRLPAHLEDSNPATTTAAPWHLLSFFSSGAIVSTTPPAAFVCLQVYGSDSVTRPTDVVMDSAHSTLYWIEMSQEPRIMRGNSNGLLRDRSSAGDDARGGHRGRHQSDEDPGPGFSAPTPTSSGGGGGDDDDGAPFALVSSRLGRPRSLCLDLPTRKLFWVDARMNLLESIGLDGLGRRMTHAADMEHPFAMTVFEHRAFWADDGASGVMAADKFSGHDPEVFVAGVRGGVRAMTVLHAVLEPRAGLNKCRSTFCDGICLESVNLQANCACPDGSLAEHASGSCQPAPPGPRLFGAFRNEIISTSLSRFSPLDFESHRAEGMTTAFAVALLPASGDLLYSDVQMSSPGGQSGVSSIHRMTNVLGGGGGADSGPATFTLMEGVGSVECLAADERSKLIYWVDRRKSTVRVSSLDGQYRTDLPLENSPHPHALVLDKKNKLLYVSDVSPESPAIKCCHQDGHDCQDLVTDHLARPTALALTGDRLFWADFLTGEIQSVDLVTGGVTRHVRSRNFPQSLAVFGDVLFWTEQGKRSIFYVHLDFESIQRSDSGAENPALKSAAASPTDEKYPQPTEIYTGREGLASILISANSQEDVLPGDDELAPNGCLVSNGGCEQICIPCLHGVTCFCSDGYSLSKDAKSCEKKDIDACDDGFVCQDRSACLHLDEVCDSSIQCDDGSDERNCTSAETCEGFEFGCGAGSCLPKAFVCDHDVDCADGRDEAVELCTELYRKCGDFDFPCHDGSQCTKPVKRCDGHSDCPDGSDELDCDWLEESDGMILGCKAGRFYCRADSECILDSWRCDGDQDCDDGEDELDCPPVTCPPLQHSCPNGACVTDPDHCEEASTHGSVGLTLAPAPAVCKDDEFRCLGGECIASFLVCDDHGDCPDASDELDDACQPGRNPCEGMFTCASGDCLIRSLVCDGLAHCRDGSDEVSCDITCQTFHGCSHRCEDTPEGPKCSCFHGYRLVDSHTCEDVDECQAGNGLCSQVCVNVPGRHYCRCLDGFELEPSTSRCKAKYNRPRIYVATDAGILRFKSSTPSPQTVARETRGTPLALDIDMTTRHIYWVEARPAFNNSVITKNKIVQDLEARSQTSVLYRSRIDPQTRTMRASPEPEVVFEEDGTVRDIAVDWITGNVYFTVEKRLKSGRCLTIRVADAAGHVATIIDHDDVFPTTGDGSTFSGLAVHPRRSLLAWFSGRRLVSSCMDGSHHVILVDDAGDSARALSLEHSTERLYWVTGKQEQTINVCHLDGSNHIQFRAEARGHITFMDVFEGIAYFSLSLSCVHKSPRYKPRAESHELDTIQVFTPARLLRSQNYRPGHRQHRPRHPHDDQVHNHNHDHHNHEHHHHGHNHHHHHHGEHHDHHNHGEHHQDHHHDHDHRNHDRLGRSVDSVKQFPSQPQPGSGCLDNPRSQTLVSSGPVRVAHKLRQPWMDNPCPEADCEFLCLLAPEGPTCVCPDGHQADPSNPSCRSVKPVSVGGTPSNTGTTPSHTGTIPSHTSKAVTSGSKVTTPHTSKAVASGSKATTPPKEVSRTSSTTSSTQSKLSTPREAGIGDSQTCTTCLNGGRCNIKNGEIFCVCSKGYHGERCQKRDATDEGESRGGKGTNPTVWIVVGVIGVVFLATIAVTACLCFRRKRTRGGSLVGGIAFWNPPAKGDKEQLVPRVTFNNSRFQGLPAADEEVVDEECGPSGDHDWWKRLLERSRISLGPHSTGCHRLERGVSMVMEEEEEEEEEGAERGGGGGRVETRGGGVGVTTFNGGGGRSRGGDRMGGSPQCRHTCDKANLLM